jgi:hypothetical protein
VASVSDLATQVHREATRATIQELAAFLQDLLTSRVTALLAGQKDAKTVRRWASGEVTVIRDSMVEQRLRTAYEVSRMLLQFDSPETVRAWFIGLNPQLGDVSPVDVLAQGDLKEVRSAARAFIAGG